MTLSTSDCPHGMPSKASCVECMYDGPVGASTPRQTEKLTAVRWMAARYEGKCARNWHDVETGDRIGYVEGVGWCCSDCAT